MLKTTLGSTLSPRTVSLVSEGVTIGSPLCRNSKQSQKTIQATIGEGSYKKKRGLSHFDEILRIAPILQNRLAGMQEGKSREEKRTVSRKKDQSKKTDNCIPITKELVESLASLRMDATSLKAILSNEMFRLRQSCTKEQRLIEDLFQSFIDQLTEQRDTIVGRLNKQSVSLINEIGSSMKKVVGLLSSDRSQFEVFG